MTIRPAHDPSEPLSAFFRPVEPAADEPLRTLGFEYTSWGDRVRGTLLHPTAERPLPLVLLGHATGSSRDAAEIAALSRAWAARGAAVAAIDLPLHGDRASGKLGERVLRAASGAGADDLDADLWAHLVHQAVADLQRALAVLTELPAIDAGRLGYAGFGLGAVVGSHFCAAEPTLSAAALAGSRSGAADAAPVAVAVEWLDRDDFSEPALDAAWHFLARHLGLDR